MCAFSVVRPIVRSVVSSVVNPRGNLGGFDPAITAFATESGATDLTGLNNLVVYLKAQSLYNNFVVYPMKSAQNAGSDATVYSLGGLTTNNMTLINAPTWGSSGITYNGTTQYGHIADFQGSTDLTCILRTAHTVDNTNVDILFSHYDTGLNQRQWYFGIRGDVASDPYEILRAPNGTATGTDSSAGGIQSSADRSYLVELVNGAGCKLFINKTETITDALAITLFDSTADITIGGMLNSGALLSPSQQVARAAAFFNVVLTATQRETITDYINAL